ncbi:hypothetical protein KGP36_06485 [Patescibacteria group bacterium]|nr:hypothetical protein [Patescibacteria group bacterium]
MNPLSRDAVSVLSLTGRSARKVLRETAVIVAHSLYASRLYEALEDAPWFTPPTDCEVYSWSWFHSIRAKAVIDYNKWVESTALCLRLLPRIRFLHDVNAAIWPEIYADWKWLEEHTKEHPD